MRTVKGHAAMMALWFLPAWLVRLMPPSFHEAVEREVYDGLTRHEWFVAQVAELQAVNARKAALVSGSAKGGAP